MTPNNMCNNCRKMQQHLEKIDIERNGQREQVEKAKTEFAEAKKQTGILERAIERRNKHVNYTNAARKKAEAERDRLQRKVKYLEGVILAVHNTTSEPVDLIAEEQPGKACVCALAGKQHNQETCIPSKEYRQPEETEGLTLENPEPFWKFHPRGKI